MIGLNTELPENRGDDPTLLRQQDGKKMLKLDKSKFEKAAKALDLDFVAEVKKPYCTIAKVLIPPVLTPPSDEQS